MHTRFSIVLVAGVLALAGPAHASFPGANGKFAFSGCTLYDICTMNQDGSGTTPLTSFGGQSGPRGGLPAWSADGRKLSFALCPPGCTGGWKDAQIQLMNADGSGIVNTGVYGMRSAWSPDDTKLAFEQTGVQGDDIAVMDVFGFGVTRIAMAGRQRWPEFRPAGAPKIAFVGDQNGMPHIYTMNPDGTGVLQVTGQGSRQFDTDSSLSWSPDGTKIAFSGTDNSVNSQVFVVNADGTGLTRLTNDPDFNNLYPVWSPDGAKIAFNHSDTAAQGDPSDGYYTMNADGTGRALISTTGGIDSWQALLNAYPRPKGASPIRASLVPAFKPCSSSNNTHGSPLAFPSCSPPVQASSFLTIGTPPQDPANSVGGVSAKVVPGDVELSVSVTDVRNQGSLSDYSGELESRIPLRVTDKDAGVAATAQDSFFSIPVPCAATSDLTVGSTCSVATTANTVVPGAVTAGLRAIWAVGQVGVYDGGPDGSASTTDGNTLFMTQGVFVP